MAKCADKLNCLSKLVYIPGAHKHDFVHAKAVVERKIQCLYSATQKLLELSQNKCTKVTGSLMLLSV